MEFGLQGPQFEIIGGEDDVTSLATTGEEKGSFTGTGSSLKHTIRGGLRTSIKGSTSSPSMQTQPSHGGSAMSKPTLSQASDAAPVASAAANNLSSAVIHAKAGTGLGLPICKQVR